MWVGDGHLSAGWEASAGQARLRRAIQVLVLHPMGLCLLGTVKRCWLCTHPGTAGPTLVCRGEPSWEGGTSGGGAHRRRKISRLVGLRDTREARADRKSSMRTQP